MNMMKVAMLVSLGALLCLCYTASSTPSPPPPARIVSFNKVSMIWPISFCSIGAKCTVKPLLTQFSLHGIWPSDSDGVSVESCRQVPPLSQSMLPVGIEAYWPSYKGGNMPFWASEWKHHGSCTPVTANVYFQTGVNIMKIKRPEIFNALNSQGIRPHPTATYRPMDIYNVLATGLKIHPQLNCKARADGALILYEIRLCYDLNMVLQNCTGGRIKDITGCGGMDSLEKKTITFPLTVPVLDLTEFGDNQVNKAP